MTQPDLGFTHLWTAAQAPDAPVALLLHGTGGDEHDLVPLARLLLPGAAVLSPRGNVLERGMPRFFRRLAPGVFDLDDLIARTRELAGFIRNAGVAYGFDHSRLVAVGFSNGANIAANLLLTEPDALSRAVLFRAMVPAIPARLPDLSRAHVYLGAGERDEMIPRAEPETLADLLRRAGADVTLQWDAGGHGLTQDAIEGARAWLSNGKGHGRGR